MISGILSDLDGVLVDSRRAHERAWGAWAARHGLDPAATAQAAHGIPAPEAVAALAPWLDARSEGEAVERAQVADVEGVEALAGARELLGGTLVDVPVAIVTSATRELATARLGAAGLPVPDAMITVERVRRGKPHPEPYLLGAAALRLAPAACLVLEDAPSGVASGRAAGATVVALRTTHPASALEAADAILTDVSELPAWLASNGR